MAVMSTEWACTRWEGFPRLVGAEKLSEGEICWALEIVQGLQGNQYELGCWKAAVSAIRQLLL